MTKEENMRAMKAGFARAMIEEVEAEEFDSRRLEERLKDLVAEHLEGGRRPECLLSWVREKWPDAYAQAQREAERA